MSLARAVAWNTVVQVGGRAVGLVASITFTGILIRHLEIATYGQYVAAATYVGMFMILGEAGLYLVAVRRAMQDDARRAQILGTALSLRLLWTVVPLSVAVGVAQLIPESRFPTYEPVVKRAIAILALNEYLRLLCQFLTAVFRMHLRMDLAVVGEVGSRVLALLGVVVVARSEGGLVSVSVALLIANFGNVLYAWIVSQRLERLRPRLDAALARDLVGEAFVIMGVLVTNLLRAQLGIFLLTLMRPSEDVGIYGVATKVHEVMVTFPGLFLALIFPVLSRLATQDRTKLARVFQRTFDVLLLAAVGVALSVIVLAPQFASILGEPRAAAPMRLLALTLPAVFLGMSLVQLSMADGRQGLVLRVYTLLAVATLGLNVVLIPRYSFWSVAAVSMGIETLLLLTFVTFWVRTQGMRLRLRSLWSVPTALVWGSVLVWFGKPWLGDADASLWTRLWIAALFGALSLGGYALVVLRTRLVDPEVVRSLLPGRAARASWFANG